MSSQGSEGVSSQAALVVAFGRVQERARWWLPAMRPAPPAG